MNRSAGINTHTRMKLGFVVLGLAVEEESRTREWAGEGCRLTD